MNSDPLTQLRAHAPRPDDQWAGSAAGQRVMDRALELGATAQPARQRVARPSRRACAAFAGAVVVSGAVAISVNTLSSEADPRDQPRIARSEDPALRASATDRRHLIDNLTGRGGNMNTRQIARTLADYLPNQLFAIGDGDARPEAAGVVHGTVVNAVGARGYYVPGGPGADAPSGTETGFEDPRAQWRIIDATVEVRDAVGLGPVEQVHVGIVVDGDEPRSLLRGAESLGEVVVVLDGQGFFRFDPTLYNIDGLNALLGTVGKDGTITFGPLGRDSKEFLAGLTDWASVRAEAGLRKAPIRVDSMGNRANGR